MKESIEDRLQRKVSESVGHNIGKLLKPVSGKRELRKYETIEKIVDYLPSTLQILNRRTKVDKTTLKRYLTKLMWLRIVEKELDMYFLNADYESLNPNAPPRIKLIWDDWQKLPEYKTPSVLLESEKGLALKWVLKGKKTNLDKHARETYKKKAEENKEK